MDAARDADSDDVVGPPEQHKRARLLRTRTRKWIAGVLAFVLVVLLAGVVDLVLISNRIDTVDVTMPSGGSGETYVLVGSDSRESLPDGLTTEGVGTTADVPGARADIVLVLHVTDAGTSVLSLPRDLVVQKPSGAPSRIALTLTESPQTLVDGLCQTLNIPTDHLIIFNFTAFIGLVDELGGIDVQIDNPVRDTVTGLEILDTGLIHLDGVKALALARSRHPELLQDGVWVPVTDGAGQRTNSAGLIFRAALAKIAEQKSNPLRLQQLAWTMSGAIVTDDNTGLFDLLAVSRLGGDVVDVPADSHDGVLALTASAATTETLQQAGFDQPCQVEG